MGFIKNLLNKIFDYDEFAEEDDFLWDEELFWREDDEETASEETDETNETDETEPVMQDDNQWDWDTFVNERTYLKVSDPYEREKLIRSLVEQVKNASGELDKLQFEYNVVTAALKDMDELDALPPAEKQNVTECAKKILYYQKEKQDYQSKKSKLTESQYYKMEQYEDSFGKIYQDMHKAEKYRELVKEDLSRLEGEKHAYQYRIGELKASIVNCKSMFIIIMMTMGLLFLMLAVMQFGFEMEVMVGYFLTIVVGAVGMTILFVRYQDQNRDLARAESGFNRIILLQNTVKIRYVNNVNLLDYLYVKYSVKSAKEWNTLSEFYEEERRAREVNELNEEELDYYQAELLRILRNFHLSDPRLWVRYPLALYDRREMVEIRHEHIIRRQKLRAQMDYNKRLAKEAEKEIRHLIAEYPQYGREILAMMNRYE